MSNVTKEQVIEWLSGQSVIDLAALVKDLEGKWGVSAAAAVSAAPAGAAAAAAPAAEAQTEGGMDQAPRRAQDVRLGYLLVSLDQPLATLEVAVADRAVQVDRRVLESLEEVEVQRALVELVARAHGESVREEGDVVVQRTHGPIHNIADPVPHGQGRQEREHQIRTGPGTPLPGRFLSTVVLQED